jgi:pimeloyl-ACP methyl ester carboxylesterase
LVLVHGLAGSTAWWSRNVHVFSRCYTVYVVDLPGFGAMYKYADQFSIHKAPEWLRALLTALSIERAYIVGHSMGGLIAALFAARWPEFAPKIVLAAPAIDLSRKSVRSFFLPLGRQVFYTHPRFLPTLVRDSVRAGVHTLLTAARELLTMDIDRELADITSPCLLVWGDRDPLVPVSTSSKLQSSPRAVG